MLEYLCKCPNDAAMRINFTLLLFIWISNLFLNWKYFLRVLLQIFGDKLINITAQMAKTGPSSKNVCKMTNFENVTLQRPFT